MNDETAHTSTDQQVTPTAKRKGPDPSVIRLRAFILGLLIIPVDSFWVIMMEKVHGGPFPTIISIFANVVCILAVLAAVNSLLLRINWRLAFSSAEMLLIYTMVAISASLAGHDMIPSLVGMMMYPWRGATPENRWAETFIPHLPKYLSVSDPLALKSLYEGNASFIGDGFWHVWLAPILWWTAFVTILIFVMMCINTLVRKQWSDRERLSFPIVQLPVAMTEPKGEIWRNRLFWGGFAIAFTICLLNGLAKYFPNIPVIPIGLDGHDFVRSFPSKPWNAIGWTPYTFYPFVIGLGYLLPADLSFSCWFFYIFWKLELVVASMMGMEGLPDFPYVRHQAFGGYVAIIVTLAWTSKGYLKQVWLHLTNQKSELDDTNEPLSYRVAVAGALIGFILLSMFMVKIGLSPLLAILAFLIYFVLAIAIARMRAELGPPVHDLHFSGPDYMISSSMGLSRLSNRDFVGLTYFYWFNRAYRSHPMPIGIEGMKMAQTTKSSQKRFFWAMMIAAVVGVAAAFLAELTLGYRLGFATKFAFKDEFAREAFGTLDSWWKHPAQRMQPLPGANLATMCGFAFCILLSYARFKVFNFPFHPIGFAISGSWSMNLVWIPILISWLLKVVTLRYGGLRLYKTAVPFFFGLILGEMIMGCLWTIVGLIGYHFDPSFPYYSFWGA